jgi:cobaltochelatase CobN
MRRLTFRATRAATIVAWLLATAMSASSAWAQAALTERALTPAETPRIVLVGGPDPLWPQIIGEYERRYPWNTAVWEVGTSQSGQADLVFAYYPTQEQLRGTLPLSATHRLGFPTEFVAAAWKQPIDQDASARASAYLDEGGVKNGVQLLAYLFSLVRPDVPAAEPPIKGPQVGIYHPAAGSVFSDFDTYREWWQNATRATRTNPDTMPSAVAVSFFSTSLRGRDLAAVDAIIGRLEGQGRLPVAVFGYPLDRLTSLLQSRGIFQPEVAIALNATLSSPKDAEIYQSWGVPVLNGLVTRESTSQWRTNPKGLPADRVAAHLSFPERSGLIAPTLVATTETGTNGVRITEPFIAGVDALLERVQRMLMLRSTPNSDKRVALIYYDNPAGKGNIGASYLQVFPSLRNIVAGLAGEGYDIPEPLPDETTLRRLLEANGRNVELWAEGETQRMAAASGLASGMMRWPIAAYRRYYNELPVEFRTSVEEVWGAPERSRLMTADCPQGRCLLLPVQQQGHVLLAPQPLRTTFERASDPSHEKVTPPPHQYIAFYLWLQHEWKADALVHVGRHGTLEWLPGKQTALAPEDAVSILLGGLPNFNVYVMDGGGEAIQAKRRGLATLVSHLTPMIWRAGGRADLETLHQSFHTLMDRADELSPELASEYERVTRAELVRLGLDRQLNLDMHADWRAMALALHRFLHDIENAPVPAGLPVFGQSPREDQLREAVSAYLFAAFPRSVHDEVEAQVPAWSDAFLAGSAIALDGLSPEITAVLTRAQDGLPAWIRLLRESGQAEMEGLLAALRGAHLPSRLLGDPLRKPEALPTGANLHAVDSARIPTDAAWRVGQKMADEFLQRYQASHGAPPKRVSLVLWYGETERQQGAMESMAMALLGVRPMWNQQGILEDLQLVEREELGRDRVDVVFTVSGNYRDGFPDKLQLLDRAVRLAGQATDGVVAARDREVATALEVQGIDPAEAARQSQVRVFSAKPGAYGVGIQYLVEKSGGGDSADQIAALYTANMGFGYSADRWGTASGAALRANLRSIDAVQFSRSSNLYGSLDNDDTYQYVGGLRTAIAQVATRAPEVYLHNLRQAGDENIVSLREWLAVELHSRQLNPTWIQEMQKSGYAGAREMSKEIEHLYGFQKTAPDHLDSQTWQTVLDVFVKDTYRLGLRRFFEEQNPHARQTMLARLLEIDRQGIQRFSSGDRQMLLTEYARSVTRDGAACNAQICGNVVLRRHVTQQLRRHGGVADAATMDAVFRRTLMKTAARVAATSTIPPRVSRVVEWRTLATYVTSWTNPWPLPWKGSPAPWWVWVGFACGHVAVGVLLARARRRSTVEPITLL